MEKALQVEVKKATKSFKVPEEKLSELRGIGNRLLSLSLIHI